MNKMGALLTSVIALAGYASAAEAQSYCREYTKAVMVGGQMQPGYGLACLQPDGAWEMQLAGDGYQKVGQDYLPYPPAPNYGPPPSYYAPVPHYAAPGIQLGFNFGHDDRDAYRGHDEYRERDHRGGGHGRHGGGRNRHHDD